MEVRDDGDGGVGKVRVPPDGRVTVGRSEVIFLGIVSPVAGDQILWRSKANELEIELKIGMNYAMGRIVKLKLCEEVRKEPTFWKTFGICNATKE